MNPAISIIMSAYNSEKYISYSIRSILNQTFSDFELLIVDDASTDHTADIISSFADERVKLHINNDNLGLTKNLNSCIKNAKGKYIARIDSDDVCTLNRLSEQYYYMESHPDIDVLGSNAYLIDEDGKVIGVTKEESDDQSIKQKSIFMNPMIHPTVMIRRSKIIEYMYDENFRTCQDYDLWIRMIPTCRFECLSQPLIYYRLNKSGATRKARNNIKERIDLLAPIVVRSVKNSGINLNQDGVKQILALVLNYHDRESNDIIITIYKGFDRNIIGNHLDMSLVRYYKFSLLRYGLIFEMVSGSTKWLTYFLKQICIYILRLFIQKEYSKAIK